MDFYNLLYRGYTGEYQLVSSLYRNGLDAVRPPADMGVDVVSLNLKAQLENPQAAPETFFFQVKTASTPINDASMSNGLRALTTVQFKLKESEVDLLAKVPTVRLCATSTATTTTRSPTLPKRPSCISGLTAHASRTSAARALFSSSPVRRS